MTEERIKEILQRTVVTASIEEYHREYPEDRLALHELADYVAGLLYRQQTVLPEGFIEGLRDIESGRVVDLEVALNTAFTGNKVTPHEAEWCAQYWWAVGNDLTRKNSMDYIQRNYPALYKAALAVLCGKLWPLPVECDDGPAYLCDVPDCSELAIGLRYFSVNDQIRRKLFVCRMHSEAADEDVPPA